MASQHAALLSPLRSFLIKIAIYWFAELVICQIDGSRLICQLIGKGFLPCLVSFAIMDFIVVPWLRKALKRRRHRLGPIDDWWKKTLECFRGQCKSFSCSQLLFDDSMYIAFNNWSLSIMRIAWLFSILLSPLMVMMRLCGCIAPSSDMGFAHGPEVTNVIVMNPIGRCGNWIETGCNLLHAPMHETGRCIVERIHVQRIFECVESKILFQ